MGPEQEQLREWYYKQGGETFGPVSTKLIQDLLATGRLLPRQAVWSKRSPQMLIFIHAATAAQGNHRSPAGRAGQSVELGPIESHRTVEATHGD